MKERPSLWPGVDGSENVAVVFTASEVYLGPSEASWTSEEREVNWVYWV